MTLGIPTQSDAVDVKYKKALKQERIKNQINSFPASTVDIHNAINSHYNGNTVDSKEILDLYLNKIQNFNENLFKGIENNVSSMKYTFDSWDHPNECHIGILQEPNKRYRILMDASNIKVTERSKIVQKIFNKPKYKISFSPYRTAMTESSSLRSELKNSQKGRKTIDDLLSMEGIIEDFEKNNANTAILNYRITNRFKTSDEFEFDKNSDVYKLKQKHKKIAEQSEIYLQFQENYWIINTNSGEKGYPIKGKIPYPTSSSKQKDFLNSQVDLKKNMEEKLNETGTIIFNGEIFDSWKGIIEYYSSQDFLNPFSGNNWTYG